MLGGYIDPSASLTTIDYHREDTWCWMNDSALDQSQADRIDMPNMAKMGVTQEPRIHAKRRKFVFKQGVEGIKSTRRGLIGKGMWCCELGCQSESVGRKEPQDVMCW